MEEGGNTPLSPGSDSTAGPRLVLVLLLQHHIGLLGQNMVLVGGQVATTVAPVEDEERVPVGPVP